MKPYFRKSKRTAEGLRDFLFDELDCFRSGKRSAHQLIAVTHVARQIIAIARIELDAGKPCLRLGTEPPVDISAYEVNDEMPVMSAQDIP